MAILGVVLPTPIQTALDANGHPISGALLYSYLAGTMTPQPLYADADLSTPLENPVEADGAGRFPAMYTGATALKLTLTDANDVPVWSADDVAPGNVIVGGSTTLDVTGTAGENLSAGDGVYLSDGSGGKTAGRWYKAANGDTYSSTTPQVGFAPSAISLGASGSIRQGGVMTGLSGLVAGTTYYIGATPGTLTASVPTNARVMGVATSTTTLLIQTNPGGPTLTALNASQLTTGTVPDGRFPATLPAVSGANLVNLNATQLTSGTIPNARLTAGTRGYALPFGCLMFDPNDAETIYIGPSPRVPTTTAAVNRLYFPRDGTVTKILLGVTNDGTAGSATTSTVWLRLNNTTDAITITTTLNTSANSYTLLTGQSLAVVGGDYAEIKWTTPTWATNPTSIRVFGWVWVE